MWRKRGHTRGMLRIPMAEGLTPWGLIVDCFQLEARIGMCCCWRCQHVVMTDAGSHPELVAWASHFWSSGSVIVIVNGADWLLLFVHWGPWVCAAGAPDHGLPHSLAALDNWI